MQEQHNAILLSLAEAIKSKLGENTWRDWFSNTSIEYNDGYYLVFPNEFVSRWVVNKYSDLINETAEIIGITLKTSVASLTKQPAKQQSQSAFNSKFTFNNFIVDNSNMIANEAALKVATSKEIAFNPLFIHSSVGLGKTHLLNAIANKRTELFPSHKIVYLSAEQFINKFIRAIQQKSMMAFKEELRTADLLLIDDFQFLASKEATQEEFFHTLNSLISNQKQLVISADKHPSTLPGVDARLKSRLGWGLVVDIHQASYELKLCILSKKAADFGHNIAKEVIDYIATTINSSIRELEGALLKVIKYAEWTKTEVSLSLAKSILCTDSRQLKTPLTLLNHMCKLLDVSLSEIQSDNRQRNIVRARQKITYILRNHANLSYVQIGKLLGNRDHTSIMYAEKQAIKFLNSDINFTEDISKIENDIRQ